MTEFQYILAHSYEQGYYGLQVDKNKSKYWLEYKPKVHKLNYECKVADLYDDGTFPDNLDLFNYYKNLCEINLKKKR